MKFYLKREEHYLSLIFFFCLIRIGLHVSILNYSGLVPPEEILKSISLFKELAIPYTMTEYGNGLKIIEASFISSIHLGNISLEQEFHEKIQQYVNDRWGVTPDFLSNKLSISLAISKTKLMKLSQLGILALDDRLDGCRYFKNILL